MEISAEVKKEFIEYIKREVPGYEKDMPDEVFNTAMTKYNELKVWNNITKKFIDEPNSDIDLKKARERLISEKEDFDAYMDVIKSIYSRPNVENETNRTIK